MPLCMINVDITATIDMQKRVMYHIIYWFQGLGFGFAYNLSYTIINDYFVKKRLMAISLGHTAIGK